MIRFEKRNTMKKTLIPIVLILCHLVAKADTWIDPSWKKMISGSHAIALIEYASDGDFRAQARVLQVYKGKLGLDTIWISGFSNRYGPIDTVRVGDRYIVFLIKNKPTKENLDYWNQKIKEDKSLIPYVEAIKKKEAFYVWSPTSGDLKVRNRTVQYDLLQTTYHEDQQFYAMDEFERFLRASYKKRAGFHKVSLATLKNNINTNRAAQLLMMLYLTNYKKYESLYQQIRETNLDNSHYALAKLLGNIAGDKSRKLLVDLLDSQNSIVQGEAVRQLSKEPSDFIGPILLSKLPVAGEEGFFPGSIMDPVRNTLDGGKIEIIKALGELDYKPAIPELLPLLETDNEYLFTITFEVLDKLGTRDYIPYLNAQLLNLDSDLTRGICDLITERNLTECIPSLMSFVSNHDRSIHPSKEYTISFHSGLGAFNTPEVRTFLMEDFEKVLAMEREGSIDNKKDWILGYIQTFDQLKMTGMKPSVFDAMFEYYGFNSAFKKDTTLFRKKLKLEETFKDRLAKFMEEPIIDRIDVQIQIDSLPHSNEILDYSLNIVVDTDKRKWKEVHPIFDGIRDKMIAAGYDKNALRLTTGNMVQDLGGAKPIAFRDNLMLAFLDYISSNPDKMDLVFLKQLRQYEYAKSDYGKRRLNNAIDTCEAMLRVKK